MKDEQSGTFHWQMSLPELSALDCEVKELQSKVGGAKCHRSVTGFTSPRMLHKSFGLMGNCKEKQETDSGSGWKLLFKLLSYFRFTRGHCSYMSVKHWDEGRIRTERYISIIRRCFPLGGRRLNHAQNKMRSVMAFERISLVCCMKI